MIEFESDFNGAYKSQKVNRLKMVIINFILFIN